MVGAHQQCHLVSCAQHISTAASSGQHLGQPPLAVLLLFIINGHIVRWSGIIYKTDFSLSFVSA